MQRSLTTAFLLNRYIVENNRIIEVQTDTKDLTVYTKDRDDVHEKRRGCSLEGREGMYRLNFARKAPILMLNTCIV